ncbi:MAG: hypothetical protein CMG74_02410 [Candidatus Marinimicrobia bacterium]|nr:hypothetical protein [Candidatus Neomarinimicrobiota bacterium]
MKISLVICILFSILTAIVKAEEVSISGVIQDTTGNPIKKADVSLVNLRNVVLEEQQSGRKGEFIIKDIKPDYYYLVVNYKVGESAELESYRIKINPGSMKKSKSLDLQIILPIEKNTLLVYSLAGTGPITDHDPVLNLNPPSLEVSPEHISVFWEDIQYASNYLLFENGEKIRNDSLNRYERDVSPGKEFCYEVQAFDKYGFWGLKTGKICNSAPTKRPRDIQVAVAKNSLTLNWSVVNGAESYNIYRDGKRVGAGIDTISFEDTGLEYNKDYIYAVAAMDSLEKESKKSIEIKGTTHEYVPAPILSSVKDKNKLILIWNEVELAKSFNIYRGDQFVTNVQGTSFSENKPPGEKYCYVAKSVDQYNEESDPSNNHCAKVEIQAPNGITADGGVNTIYLNWNPVIGAVSYNIYEVPKKDSMVFVKNVDIHHISITDLPYGEEFCYAIAGVDSDGDKSEYSQAYCENVFTAPEFFIHKFDLIEPSGNGYIDAREVGKLQFAVYNKGESPAHNVKLNLFSPDRADDVTVSLNAIIDTLIPDKIEYIDFDIMAALTVKTAERSYELTMSSIGGIILEKPYKVIVETKEANPANVVIADFAISNDFGAHYIPENEEVEMTVRLQNIGEGNTEYVILNVLDSATFSTPGFEGSITTSGIPPGDFIDIEFPLLSKNQTFTVNFQITDYLDVNTYKEVKLGLLQHYNHPEDMTIIPFGADSIDLAQDMNDPIDVDSNIPFGRKNIQGMGIILATQNYDDSNYPKLEYADRDGNIMREYFQNAFGLSDYQLLPSKPWQMDGGPTLNDLINTFDPHQGDLRRRIVNSKKYSGVEEIDILIYYRGLGEWIEGKPFLIPKDAKFTRNVTKYSLDRFVKDLSVLSVINSIQTVTLFLDISFTNPKDAAGSIWDFPDLNEKICILSASSKGESSQLYPLKKHSLFLYSLLKGLSKSDDDGDAVVELGELTDFIYKSIPQELKGIPNTSRQNPVLYGLDLKRTILDLR